MGTDIPGGRNRGRRQDLPGTTGRDASDDDEDDVNVYEILTYVSSFHLILLYNIIREFILFSFHRAGQTAKELECQAKQFTTMSFTIGDFVNFSGMQYILSFWKSDMEFRVLALQAFFREQKST